MDVESMTNLMHAVFTDIGVHADFYLSDGVLGEETGEKLWSYMGKNGYGTFISVVWGKGMSKTNSWGGKKEGMGVYAFSAYPVVDGKPSQSPEEIYLFGAENSGEMVAKLQADVAAGGLECSPIENPDTPIFVALEEVKLPSGKKRAVYEGWPSDLKSGTLIVPIYPLSGTLKTGNKKQDKKSEKWAARMNKAIIRKNEDLKKTMKSYDHDYALVEGKDIDQYKGKKGNYLLLDRARSKTDRVYDMSSKSYKTKSYTYYRYAVKDLATGDVYEGNGKESKSYVIALRYLLKYAEK